VKQENKNKESASRRPAKKSIRLRLNYRTVVTVKSDEALKAWLKRYPEATILDDN